ncbi:hypothetical protein KP509_10G065900 [Ceratopteris richardii]|nr:hypothetical protein KP509_10G065900 [Ceratopteris richardii]
MLRISERRGRSSHRQRRGFSASSSSVPVPELSASDFPQERVPNPANGEQAQEVAGVSTYQDGIGLSSLQKSSSRPLSDLESACIQMLWRRNAVEPIEETLKRAEFPLTPANLPFILTHVRSPKDALRSFLCCMRDNPSFVPGKTIISSVGRFWQHERERFPMLMSIIIGLRSSSIQMTPRKLTTLIRGYGWAGLVEDVRYFLGTCEASHGFKPDFIHFISALHNCVVEKRMDTALQIFKQMQESKCLPTRDMFKCLITELLKSKQGIEAAFLFEQMYINEIVKPSEYPSRVVSYIDIVNNLLLSENLVAASAFLLRMNHLGFKFDYFTCSKVLNAYHARGLIHEQHELFVKLNAEAMIPDTESLRRMMKEINGQSLSLDALSLLNSLLTVITESSNKLNSLQKDCRDGDTNSMNGAATITNMESCVHNNQAVLPASIDVNSDKANLMLLDRIIYSLSVQKKSKDAFELMLMLAENTKLIVIPGTATTAVVLDSLCCNSEWEEAGRCLRMMMKWGHVPGSELYNLWVQGSAKAGHLEDVGDFINNFTNDSLVLDLVSHILLVEKFCIAGMLDEAKRAIDIRNSGKGTLDVVSYNRMIQCFAKVGDFDVPRKLLDEMLRKGLTPFALPFMPLVQKLCFSGKVDAALAFIEEIERKGCRPFPNLYTHVVSAYCKANRLEDAFKVMDSMKAKGITPEPQAHKDLFASCMGTRLLKPAESVK